MTEAILLLGVFPEQQWMRQLQGKHFACIGTPQRAFSLRRAQLYIGSNLNSLARIGSDYGHIRGGAGIRAEVTHVEQLTLPGHGSLLCGIVSNRASYLMWQPADSDERYDLNNCRLGRKGERWSFQPTVGGSVVVLSPPRR